MYQDRCIEAKYSAFGTAKVILINGVQWILRDVYMEAIAKYRESFNLITDYDGFWEYEEEPIDHTNLITAEHDIYPIKEVLEIISIDKDWEIIDEWEYNPWEYQYA